MAHTPLPDRIECLESLLAGQRAQLALLAPDSPAAHAEISDLIDYISATLVVLRRKQEGRLVAAAADLRRREEPICRPDGLDRYRPVSPGQIRRGPIVWSEGEVFEVVWPLLDNPRAAPSVLVEQIEVRV